MDRGLKEFLCPFFKFCFFLNDVLFLRNQRNKAERSEIMDTISIQTRIRHIDSRVKQLEKINDEYSAKHGIMNYGVYNKIQNLMDERDRLYAQLA